MPFFLRPLRGLSRLALGWGVYGISFLTPRFKRRWVFIGWQKSPTGEVFADNAKYFFLYVAVHAKEHGLDPVWIAKDSGMEARLRARGYPVARQGTLKGAWYALTAGYTIVDAHLLFADWKYVGRSTLIQLWHGITIKKIGAQLGGLYRSPSKLFNPEMCRKHDLIVAPSSRTANIMCEAMQEHPSKIFISGYPRNDILTEPMPGSDIDAYEVPAEMQRATKAVLYAPTFRAAKEKDPLEYWDFEKLMPLLEKHDAVLCIQHHNKEASRQKQAHTSTNRRIIFLSGKDIQPMLKEFDVQISDYSSLPFDTLLIDQPVIYYQYDYDTYIKNTGLQPDYAQVAVGPEARSFDTLLTTLDEILSGKDEFKTKRHAVKQLMFTHPTHGSERIFKKLIETL